MENFNKQKILIIGAAPYNSSYQSRSLLTYFRNIKKDNLFQIYTADIPVEQTICKEMLCIKDKDIFVTFFRREKIGKIVSEKNNIISCKKFTKKRKNIFTYWARYFLWNTKVWKNKRFVNFVKRANPDIIFFQPSDDLNNFKILEEVKKIKPTAKVINSFVDDYYFSSKNRFGQLYWHKYRKETRKILSADSTINIFNSQRMKTDYCNNFGINGEVIYIASDFDMKQEQYISNRIIYSGDIGLGRFSTLLFFSKILYEINKQMTIEVYPLQIKKNQKSILSRCKNISLHDKIPYKNLKNELVNSEYILLLEELEKSRNISKVKYSLSTKTGDAFMCESKIIAIGNNDTGLIHFFNENKLKVGFTNKLNAKESLISYFANDHLSRNSSIACLFKKEEATKRFEDVLKEIIVTPHIY